MPYAITPFLVLLGIPVAMAIAILRRRLFDIDVIISRALLFTLLSAGVTAVYAAIVLGIGTLAGSGSDPLLTVAAAVVIALVFQPLRQRASRLANRLVYGERATPYQVLSDFAAGMAGPARPGRRAGPDGVAAGRRGRGQPGRGVDPGRRRAAARRGLAPRFGPVRRGGAQRRRRAPPTPASRARWCRSGTAMTCSARSP